MDTVLTRLSVNRDFFTLQPFPPEYCFCLYTIVLYLDSVCHSLCCIGCSRESAILNNKVRSNMLHLCGVISYILVTKKHNNDKLVSEVG